MSELNKDRLPREWIEANLWRFPWYAPLLKPETRSLDEEVPEECIKTKGGLL